MLRSAAMALAWLCLGLLATWPAMAQFNILSAGEARQLGKQAHEQAVAEHGGIYDDPAIGALVATIGGRLVLASEKPRAEFNFSVLDSPVLNAFATPGYVHMTRGLMAIFNSEDELAFVLGHEIAHVQAEHVEQTQSVATVGAIGIGLLGALLGDSGWGQLLNLGAGLGANLGLASFSRSNETESDTLGLGYITRAGYNPRAGAIAMQALETASDLEQRLAGAHAPSVVESFFATHPRGPERVQNLITLAKRSGARLDQPLNRDRYLRALDGLIWGDSPDEGLVRGQDFLHPGLKLGFSFPEGFSISNKKQAVLGRARDGAQIRADIAAPKQSGDPAEYVMREWQPKLRLAPAERITIGGMPAATTHARVQTQQGGTVDLRLVAVQHAPNALFRFMFITPPERTQQHIEGFQRTTFSLHRLSARELAVKPLRVRIHQVRQGDTAQTLAGRMRVPLAQLEYFETLNGLQRGVPLRPGMLVKLVAE
jgi:predicted Zn-dependent protease